MNTNRDVVKLAVMTAIYARNSKQTHRSGLAQLAMYAFHDAVERTALAFEQVIDGKRTADEAFDKLLEYAVGLETELSELDSGRDEVQVMDTPQHSASEEHQPHAHVNGTPDDDKAGPAD